MLKKNSFLILMLLSAVSANAFVSCNGAKNEAKTEIVMSSEASGDAQEMQDTVKKSGYKEVSYPTPNVDPDKVNDVQGVILHHTAEPTAELALQVLTTGKKGQKNRHVGTHVVIDTDGTRYIMCRPDQVTYHAGPSLLDGREGCNNWCLGIEFQGNTLEKPLTEEQINSAIEWLLPLIDKYNIPIRNIVTHETIRKNYRNAHPGCKANGKVDITPKEYQHFMKALKSRLGK